VCVCPYVCLYMPLPTSFTALSSYDHTLSSTRASFQKYFVPYSVSLRARETEPCRMTSDNRAGQGTLYLIKKIVPDTELL
jgi:hypothetical protein